ncbi:DUF1838 family protein [Roseateles cellulosilyticus]|uniref:DUF1838 domain-containing protein n=1 Tax=Pelomonas cellulosilytica TaxID=2906762 RepID=A0ABS8XNK7_9BURK|nr:DUF1838 family protein [Pelomonas sp. P8]MCE4552880.1 DUF1838 domain-containing protein [Pelomonas sp. P8]
MPLNDPPLDRRRWLQWAAAASIGGAPLLAGAATSAAPTGRQRDYLLMRGALDDRLVVAALTGQYYGVIDSELIPMFGVVAATFTRWRMLEDGRWLSASFEHAYYTDADSGEVMAQWRNPLTGRSVPAVVHTSRPTTLLLHEDLSRHHVKPLPPGAVAEDRVSAMEEVAGELVMAQRVRTALPLPAPAKPYRYSELVTVRAPLAALRDPASLQVPASMSFTNVSGWRPWQQMPADQPGHMMAHGAGRYGLTLDTLPAIWLAETRRTKPAWWADPGAHLEAAFRG